MTSMHLFFLSHFGCVELRRFMQFFSFVTVRDKTSDSSSVLVLVFVLVILIGNFAR